MAAISMNAFTPLLVSLHYNFSRLAPHLPSPQMENKTACKLRLVIYNTGVVAEMVILCTDFLLVQPIYSDGIFSVRPSVCSRAPHLSAQGSGKFARRITLYRQVCGTKTDVRVMQHSVGSFSVTFMQYS